MDQYTIYQLTKTNEIQVVRPRELLGSEGVHFICEQDTCHITKLILNCAFIGDEPLNQIMKANFQNLIILELKQNTIGPLGCKYLSMCRFDSMQKIPSNHIDNFGMDHLQKAQWRVLSSFSLYDNSLGFRGVKTLAKAHWKNLKTICLRRNELHLMELFQLLNLFQPINRLYITIQPNDSPAQVTNFILALFNKFQLEDTSFT